MSSEGPTDTESWYTVWKQAVAIQTLCVEKNRRPGFALNLGKVDDLVENIRVAPLIRLSGVNRREIDVEITS